MNIQIRRYQSTDKQAVKDLYKLASEHSEIGYRSGPWEKDFDNIEDVYFVGGEFLVGYVGDEMVALGGYRKIDDSTGHVRRMRVHPNHRRKGYAQALLKQLEEAARQNSIQELRLRTSTAQVMAQKLYEKSGYDMQQTEKVEYYTEGPFEVIWYRKLIK